MGLNKKYILISIIILLAVVTRFLFLDYRPLHSDESVNSFFAETLLKTNHYAYDPLNYHGPIYFFLIAISFLGLGFNEFALRFPSAIFGVILIIYVILLNYKNENFNKFGKYQTGFFILLSPSILYYSRYSIHETCFVFFTFLTLYYYTHIIENKTLDYLPYFAAALAILYTIKETVMIFGFSLFLMTILNFKEIKKINFRKYTSIIAISVLIFFMIYVLFFTSFFTNNQGFTDSFKSFFSWTNRGIHEIGHDKPFYYFFNLISLYEFPILILGVLGILYSFKIKEMFYKNVSVWFLTIFFIYSFIPYKTPWLIINLTLPLCFLSGIALTELYNNIRLKKLAIILIIFTLIYLLSASVYTNILKPYQPENKFAYAHTDKDILNMVNEINGLYKPDNKILFLSKEYWPLPFYLHGKNVYYLNKENFNKKFFEEYDFIIFDKDLISKINKSSKDYKKYTLRPEVELYLLAN